MNPGTVILIGGVVSVIGGALAGLGVGVIFAGLRVDAANRCALPAAPARSRLARMRGTLVLLALVTFAVMLVGCVDEQPMPPPDAGVTIFDPSTCPYNICTAVGAQCFAADHSSLCGDAGGMCASGVCRSFCSAIGPSCDAGTVKAYVKDDGGTDACVCVPG